MARRWEYRLQTGVLVATFSWIIAFLSITYRCHGSVWYEAQVQAGLVFVGVALIRVALAAVFEDRHFNWHIYLVTCLLSPIWIRIVFTMVLRIRDSYAV
jgi:hypothetical protein